jgi:hypothetical protein
MKILKPIFGAAVAGVLVCLVMTIYTGVKEYQARKEPVKISIPLPAENPAPAQ